MASTHTYDIKKSEGRTIEGIVSAEILDSYGDVMSQESLLQKLNEMIGRGVAPITFMHSEDIIGKWNSFTLTSVDYMGKTYPAISGKGVIFETTMGNLAWDLIERGFMRGLSISAFGDSINTSGSWTIADIYAVSLVDRPAVPIAIILDNNVIEQAVRNGYNLDNEDVVRFKNSKHTLIRCDSKACEIKEYNKELHNTNTVPETQPETQEINLESLVKAEDFNAKSLEIKNDFVKVTGEIEDLKKGINAILEKLTREDDNGGKDDEEEKTKGDDNDEDKEDEDEKSKSNEVISETITPNISMIPNSEYGVVNNDILLKGVVINPMLQRYLDNVEKLGNEKAMQLHNAAFLKGEYKNINSIGVTAQDMAKVVPKFYGAYVEGYA